MEGDAGASQLNPADPADTEPAVETSEFDIDDGPSVAVDTSEPEVGEVSTDSAAALGPVPEFVGGEPSRLGIRGIGRVCAVLVLLAAAVATGGYLALRSHRHSQATAGADRTAIAAAEECVAATQTPDVASLLVAHQKILECATGDFAAQAELYSGALMQAYQATNPHVQVSDMRTAVERNNADGSVDLLMAMRVKIDNAEARGVEYGYRLRLKMAQEDGRYKIANLDQVSG